MRPAGRIISKTMGLALLLALALTGATGADPPRPNAIDQPLSDGCQRNPAGLLAFTSPEWTYVNRDPAPRFAEGTAHLTHTAGADLPQGHQFYDLNTNVDLDPSYVYLLGGDPAKKNGNFAGSDETTNRLHVEWESGTVPMYAWPTENDRLALWGSWIWDCGHWGQGINDPDYFLPGTNENPGAAGLRGEQTEFHPVRAMVVTRQAPAQTAASETEADVFISSEGNIAHATEQCALDHPASLTVSYGPDYTACVSDPANRRQPVNDRDYRFFVPAPPKPSPSAVLRYRVLDRVHGNGPQEQVDVGPDGITVTIPFKGFGKPTDTLSFGKSFFVGWEGADANPPAHLQVDLKTVKIVHSLDPNPARGTQTGIPPGEWNLYVDANGVWALLNDTAPALGAVLDGQTVELKKTLDVYVPAGRPLRLFVSGRECDLPQMAPCAATTEVSDDNDLPGDQADVFPSVAAALGDHVLKPMSGNYELAYTVRQLPNPGSGGPAPRGCADTYAPRARFTGRRVRASRRRLALSGTASDRGCGRRRGTVSRTLVSIGRRVGRLCRFLQADGRFAPAVSCLRTPYLAARGTTRWGFAIRGRFPRGRYLAWVRSIDAAGNVERKDQRRNLVRFRVR